MYRAKWICMFILLTGGSLLIAQGEDKLKSGPKVGAMMPKPFGCVNVNGPDPKVKGRPNCLVCKFALYPAVIIFARESKDGKNGQLDDLLAKLDQLAVDFDDRSFSAGVVFLSPDARDSTNNPEIKKKKDKFEETVKALEPDLKKAKDAYDEAVKAAEQDKGTPESLAAVKERKQDFDKVLKQVTAEYVKFGDELNKEAKVRKELIERLAKRTEKLKHVVVNCYPEEGPAGY